MSGELDLAIQMLQRSVAADPNHFPSHLNLAFAYEQRGDLDNALRHARSATAVNPADGRGHLQRARVLLARKDTDAAAAALTEAARWGLRDPRARIMLARTWGDLSRWDEAAATLERLTADYPDFAPAFVWLALARLELGDTEQAQMALRRATQLNPHDPAVQQLTARLRQLESQRRHAQRDR